MADGPVFSCFSVASIAGVYEDIYVPRIFVPWARLLIEQASLRTGESVLDVATGPGTVARLAAEEVGPKGRVVATDISPAMVDIARRKPRVAGGAEIHYVVSPAAPLTAPGSAFDVVTCQQGLQFFPDRGAAIREMFRALRPGGRLVVAVWREIALQPIFDAINTALHECLPAEKVAPYAAPFRWSSGQELASALRGQGFRDVRLEEHRLSVVYEGGVQQAMATLAASPVAAVIADMTEDDRKRLWDAGAHRLKPHLKGGQLHAQMVSNIATAAKGS
ncbi:MAG: class I SAM-dependent methyltransferase [Candidatus Dormibacteraeota bacterium]|nr:class I SAM-dependent methyltransferase [Candidatus Dormibacteraeota bacterium]